MKRKPNRTPMNQAFSFETLEDRRFYSTTSFGSALGVATSQSSVITVPLKKFVPPPAPPIPLPYPNIA